MRATRRRTLQEQLVRVIMRVLCSHQDMHYYQVHICKKTDFSRLDFRCSLESCLRSSLRRDSEAAKKVKFQFMRCFWSLEMSSDGNHTQAHMTLKARNICTCAVFFIIFGLPTYFVSYYCWEGHYMPCSMEEF